MIETAKENDWPLFNIDWRIALLFFIGPGVALGLQDGIEDAVLLGVLELCFVVVLSVLFWSIGSTHWLSRLVFATLLSGSILCSLVLVGTLVLITVGTIGPVVTGAVLWILTTAGTFYLLETR